jgi:hypothetical protein
MRATLEVASNRQSGLFSRLQALHAGYTRREIDAATRPGGPWVVVRAGIYCERVLIDSCDHRERWLLKDRAALLSSQRESVLSHDSAARALKIDLLEVELPGSHLTHRGMRGSRATAGITRHRDLQPLCIEEINGVLVTSYARTAIDIGRLHGHLHGLVAVDSVRNMGVPLSDLEAELERMAHHPHIARARAAVRDSDRGAESVLETLGRQLVLELGIGDVETQFAVRIAGGRIVWCDIRVGCHVFECDGLIKLVPFDQGGVATDLPAEVLREERRREVDVSAEGLGVSRIYWQDCFGAARERAKQRLRKEYAVSVQRFGRELPAALRAFSDANPRQQRNKLWLPGDLRRAA